MLTPTPSGETDLAKLLADLRPVVRDEPYVFCVLPALDLALHLGLIDAAFAIVREDEGITLVLSESVARRHGLPSEPLWSCITLMVHSSLEAVGMIAAISTRLAAAGISTNPIAGFYHDHLFVRWDARLQAASLIEQQ